MGSPKTVFVVSPEYNDFLEKLFYVDLFSIKFVIKKGYINFWHRITSKKWYCPQTFFFFFFFFFGPRLLTFGLPVYKPRKYAVENIRKMFQTVERNWNEEEKSRFINNKSITQK